MKKDICVIKISKEIMESKQIVFTRDKVDTGCFCELFQQWQKLAPSFGNFGECTGKGLLVQMK